jgi:hypothetical protein
MAGSLSVLRDFTSAGRVVDHVLGECFQFGSLRFPFDDVTEFKSRNENGRPYTLEAIWFMFEQKDARYCDYLKDCQNFKVRRVSFRDRK